MEKIIQGHVWCGRDDIVAYDIINQKRKNNMLGSNDRESAGKYTFEAIDPEFAEKARAGEYEIVFAGTNFGGGGKSIELPVHALLGSGIKIVVAESFARLFYRNAINIGMPLLTCKGILAFAKNGDEIKLDTTTGLITNLSTGKTVQGSLMDDQAQAILAAGGYVEYTKKRLAGQEIKN